MIPAEMQVGWQDYLAIVLRRRWVFTVPLLAIMAISLIVGMFLPKFYRAETVMLVEEQNVMNPLIRGLAVATPVGYRLRTLREELLGWSSLSRLVHELKLDSHARSPLAFEQLIKRLQRDISVRMRGNNLIVISYEDQDPKLAQTIVNTITNIYMDRNVESQSAEAETAISFIQSEMDVYKTKLENAERALREFKELYAMQMPVATQLNDQIVELEVALARMLVENTELHPTVIQVRRHIQDLKEKRNAELKRVIVQAMARGSDPKIFEDFVAALDQPTTSGTGDDPKVRAAKEAYQAWVGRLDNSIATQAGNGAAAPQVQVVAAAPADGQPGAMPVVAGSMPLLSLAPREEQELARLTRDYEVYSGTYQHMQQRLERAKVTQRLGESDEGTKFKILEPARLPLRPVRPNLVKIFFFSLLLGAFVGAGCAFVAEYLDQSFQSAEECQAALELPVIGSISTIVTEDDLELKRKQRKGWMSVKQKFQMAHTYVIKPVWAQVDRVLVRWGL